MISKIASILAVGVATLLVAAPTNALALNAVQQQASVAALKKQLNGLPLHKAPFSKVSSLVTQLATKDPKNASKYVDTGFDKIAILNAKKNATSLGNKVQSIVNKAKTLKPSQKQSISKAIKSLIKKYVPPGPNNPPYQAMVLSGSIVA